MDCKILLIQEISCSGWDAVGMLVGVRSQMVFRPTMTWMEGLGYSIFVPLLERQFSVKGASE